MPGYYDEFELNLAAMKETVATEVQRLYAEHQVRQELQRLEDEARVFLKMGFAVDELAIVEYPDYTRQIQPKSK